MPIVRYINVSKQFSPDSYGVINVSLEVEPGELVVITGHSGSGKTTLMKLLTREYAVSEGELYFNDTPIHLLKSNKVHLHRRQIGVVYQDYRLIKELTVWENVALPLYIAGKKDDEIEQRTSDLLNLIKLADKYDMFPNQLSGGEAQRVSIARSLALAPELIFADEPTGNLDAETSKTIALLLAKINELGTTVLLSTHDITLLDVFTNERHVVLENGALVKDSRSKKDLPTSMGIPIPPDADAQVKTVEPPAPQKSFWHSLSLGSKKPRVEPEKEDADTEAKSKTETKVDAPKDEPETEVPKTPTEKSEHAPDKKHHESHKKAAKTKE